MADSGRIEELRRRVQKDPASIAFAQLAEEYRRAGRLREAIETCETGLSHHPGYLSARVTHGRALLETGRLEEAQEELRHVLRAAPENLAALRGLAEVHYRRGELEEALAHYKAALEFARHDPELEHVIAEITGRLEPATRAPQVVDGLSFEEAARELAAFSGETGALDLSVDPGVHGPSPVDGPATDDDAPAPVPAPPTRVPSDVRLAADGEGPLPADAGQAGAAAEGQRQIEALERWLEAIVAERERRAASSTERPSDV